MSDNKFKKIFRLLFLLGLAITLFVSCSKDNDAREPERPVDNDVYTLSVDQEYIFGTTVIAIGPVDSTLIEWKSINSSLVHIFSDTSFVVSEMGQLDGEIIEIVYITSIARVKTLNSGSETLFAAISYMRDGEWRGRSEAIPRQLTIQRYDFSATHDEGVTINGVKWATRNVGTSGSFVAKPEEAGLYYRWNSKINWNGSFPPSLLSGVAVITPWSASRDSTLYPTVWDEINDPCPKGWRMPTQRELQNLFSAGKKWQSRTGVNGYWFFENNNLLFLPAAGYRYERDGKIYLDGTNGAYWSNEAATNTTAFALNIADPENSRPQNNSSVSVGYGLSCRCVKAE